MSVIAALPVRELTNLRVEDDQQRMLTFEPLSRLIPDGTNHLLLQISASHTHHTPQYCRVILNHDQRPIYRSREFSALGTHVKAAATSHMTAAYGVDIPPRAQNVYGGGHILFANAFRSASLKIFQTMGSSLETRIQRHVGVYENTTAIESITLIPWQGVRGDNRWSAGSVATLYAVDEEYLLERCNLEGPARAEFGRLQARGTNQIGFVMHLRALGVSVTGQGERVYQSINGHGQASDYVVQRFGGENTHGDRVLDGRFIEPRIGWSTDEHAPDGSYGNIVAIYPELQAEHYHQGWLSQHAAWEEVYFPVSQETGRWRRTQQIDVIRFYSRFREGYSTGSCIDAYRLSTNTSSRHVVSIAGEPKVRLSVPQGVGCLRAIVAARSNDERMVDGMLVEINDDSQPEHYVRRRMSASNGSHETAVVADNEFGSIPANGASQRVLGSAVIAFPQHAAEDREKHVISTAGTSGDWLALYGGRWRRTDAITSVTFRPRSGDLFEAGSAFELLSTSDHGANTMRG